LARRCSLDVTTRRAVPRAGALGDRLRLREARRFEPAQDHAPMAVGQRRRLRGRAHRRHDHLDNGIGRPFTTNLVGFSLGTPRSAPAAINAIARQPGTGKKLPYACASGYDPAP
jgi:hypothetical protein